MGGRHVVIVVEEADPGMPSLDEMGDRSDRATHLVRNGCGNYPFPVGRVDQDGGEPLQIRWQGDHPVVHRGVQDGVDLAIDERWTSSLCELGRTPDPC